ncbi:MAG TPA: C45 family autoproteolytic acyltransferase/hydrolase [Anaerolineaceae bacterium]|nr:C45 family autoproteolytic acyltransferase/hydrolase [Anaerolineaceae bacterium]
MTDNSAVIHHEPLQLIEVKGSHVSMGRQLGEGMRAPIQHSIENARILIDGLFDTLQLNWEGAKNQARKYMPFAQERYPQYVDELAGMAEGANVNLTELMVVNALEAVTMDALHLTKCTSLAVNGDSTSTRQVLVAHNEDWLPEDEPDVYIIRMKPEDEPAILAMSYGGLLPNVGLNEAGIAQCCDTVYPSDTRIGIPRVVVSRAVLAARTIGQAIRSTLVPLRAAGYNHLLAHESGELYNVEVSAHAFDVLYGLEGCLVHTNHYLSPKMIPIEDNSDELVHTRVRYFRALHLLKQRRSHSVETIQEILCDHVNFPDSICNHSIFDLDPRDREKTVVSLVMNLTERSMQVAWGNPCKNKYHTYQL